MADETLSIAIGSHSSRLCWTCIAGKLGTTAQSLDITLMDLGRRVAVAQALAPCESCEKRALLYRLR